MSDGIGVRGSTVPMMGNRGDPCILKVKLKERWRWKHFGLVLTVVSLAGMNFQPDGRASNACGNLGCLVQFLRPSVLANIRP